MQTEKEEEKNKIPCFSYIGNLESNIHMYAHAHMCDMNTDEGLLGDSEDLCEEAVGKRGE